MATKRTVTSLNVSLNGRLVGCLKQQRSGAIDFQYAPSWLEWEHSLAVSISLPLREVRYIGEPVLAVFENLLPDNESVRKHVAESVGAAGTDAFSLPEKIGHDCVGALQFTPDGPPDLGQNRTVSGRVIDDAGIGRIIRDLPTVPLGNERDSTFRISIAGAQEKTALLFWKNQWHVPAGSTPTTHILKPQIGMLRGGVDMSRSVENEHFCLHLMAALGLPAAQTEILDFDGQRVLSVERFDRLWTEGGGLLRLPQEDFCQALSVRPAVKYQSDGGPGIGQILNQLLASDTPDRDQRNFLKAQIVFWLTGATDGHAKNFSISLASGGGFILAPLYDVLSAQPNFDAGEIQRKNFRLAMSVGDGRHYLMDQIIFRHFLQAARSAGLPDSVIEDIFAELDDIMAGAFDQALVAMPDDFPEDMAQSIGTAALRRLGLPRQV